MVSPRHLRVERYGLTPASQSAEGWSDPGISERRGVVSLRHLRVESDGLTPASHSGEGWSHPGISEWRVMVSPLHLRAERGPRRVQRNKTRQAVISGGCTGIRPDRPLSQEGAPE